MRNNYLVALLSMIVLFASCTSAEVDTQTIMAKRPVLRDSSRVAPPQMIDFEGEQTLKFEDMASLRFYLKEGNGVDFFTPRHSFWAAYKEVDQYITEAIARDSLSFLEGERFSSIKKDSQLYALYRETEDDGAYTPYPICRASSLSEAMIANSSGRYLVGDSVCRLKLYRQYEDAVGKSVAYQEISLYPESSKGFRANNAFGKTSNRKCRGIIGVDANSKRLYITVTAQKKVGFGIKWWIRYATTYMGRLTFSELGQPLAFENVSNGFEYIRWLVDGGTRHQDLMGKVLQPGKDGQIVEFAINKETGNDTFTFGRFRPKVDPTDFLYGEPCYIRGQIEVWSRGVPYGDRGTDEIDLSFPIS